MISGVSGMRGHLWRRGRTRRAPREAQPRARVRSGRDPHDVPDPNRTWIVLSSPYPRSVHELTREQARRIAVRAQLLDAHRPADLLEVVRHLTLLQVEPTSAVAPSAHVVAWSRLGVGYRQSDLDDLLADGSLVELHSMLRPAEDLALYRAEMAAWPSAGELEDWERSLAGWVDANDDTRRDILAKLHDEGPCTTRELPDTTLVPWQSSGWNNDRNVRRLLDMMVQRGEVAAAGMDGRDKLWDLAERVYPDVAPVPLDGGLPDPGRAQVARRSGWPAVARQSPPPSPTTSARSARRRSSRASGASGASIRPTSATGSRAAPRCSHHSTASSSTASGWRSCSSSTTSSRCTSRRPSAASATGRCPSCTAMRWSARSTRPPTATPASCA